MQPEKGGLITKATLPHTPAGVPTARGWLAGFPVVSGFKEGWNSHEIRKHECKLTMQLVHEWHEKYDRTEPL